MRNPSLLLMLGLMQFTLLLLVAESLYPGYSTSQNVISDLGVGPQPSRLIFTASVIDLGVLALAAGLLYRSRPTHRWLALALIISGLGGIGLGIFNEDFHGVHYLFAFCGFFGGALAAILAGRITPRPLSIISVTLGLISLGCLVLFGQGIYLGFGQGGMKRMMFYPFMLWPWHSPAASSLPGPKFSQPNNRPTSGKRSRPLASNRGPQRLNPSGLQTFPWY